MRLFLIYEHDVGFCHKNSKVYFENILWITAFSPFLKLAIRKLMYGGTFCKHGLKTALISFGFQNSGNLNFTRIYSATFHKCVAFNFVVLRSGPTSGEWQ